MSIKIFVKTSTILFLMSSFFLLSSCSKRSGDITENQQEFETTIPENNYQESNEDLVTVNYKDVYDELSPHGEWIEVSAADIGLNSNQTSSGTSTSEKRLTKFFFIEDAYGSADIDVGAFFVWKPSSNIAVGLAAGNATMVNATPVYVPYTNGQWVNSNTGWYFQAATPYEEIVHHYGRWYFSPVYGWVWVPGRVWSPAWVTWRESDDYIAWAPVPPGVYIVNDVVSVPMLPFADYVVVERQYFVEPMIYRYYYSYPVDPFVVVPQMSTVTGVTIVNGTVFNTGPDVVRIESVYGRPINVVNINKVHVKEHVNYSSKEFRVYTPTFSKVKYTESRKNTVAQPKSFVKYEDGKMNRPQMSGSERKGNTEKDKGVDRNNQEKRTYKSTEKSNKQQWQKQDGQKREYNKEKKVGRENKGTNENKGNNEYKGNKQDKGNKQKSDQPSKRNDEYKGNQNKSKDKKMNNGDSQKNDKASDKQDYDKGNSQQDKGGKSRGKGK